MKKILVIIASSLLLFSCGTSAYVSKEVQYQSEDINLGYGTINKDHSTQATSTIRTKKVSTFSSIYDMIQGQVPGVTVVGTKIRVRGESTNSDMGDPLIFVDDIPMTDISGIAPEMVDTIDVLKDAASCAIYGVGGANGVILITLRK